jgi:hypothetical protein
MGIGGLLVSGSGGPRRRHTYGHCLCFGRRGLFNCDPLTLSNWVIGCTLVSDVNFLGIEQLLVSDVLRLGIDEKVVTEAIR